MDIEIIAREMREKALLMEGNPDLTLIDLQGRKLKQAKEQKLAQVEALKKLYFNAGRWVGGAKDHIAREAFETYNARESR